MIMPVEDVVEIRGRGLVAIGKSDVEPTVGACSITHPDGRLEEGMIVGVERMGTWSYGRPTGLIMHRFRLGELLPGSVIRTSR